MSRTIQIRDVPDDVHAKLRARAAAAGLSLSDYLRKQIEASASKPTVSEVLARAQQRAGTVSRDAIVTAVRAGRDDR